MRDPNNFNFVDTNQDNKIKIDKLPEFLVSDYNFEDDHDFGIYINTVEKCVRNSYEYRAMVSYLREAIDMNQSAYFSNIRSDAFSHVKIQIHHDPFDLMTISTIVFNKRKQCHELLDEEMVAKEVMYLHYNMLIGLIPLTKTEHKLVHNNYLFVPTFAVFGYYNTFVDMYRDYIDPSLIEVLDRIEEASMMCKYQDTHVLERNYIYLDTGEAYTLPKAQEIATFLKDRIYDLQNNNDTGNNCDKQLINPIVKLEGFSREPLIKF